MILACAKSAILEFLFWHYGHSLIKGKTESCTVNYKIKNKITPHTKAESYTR